MLAVALGAVIALAVLVCLIKAWQLPSERAIWSLLAGGKLAWGVGSLTYFADPDAASEFPWVAAGAMLLAYPAMKAGFVRLARRRLSGLPRALWLDAGIAGLAVAAVAAAALHKPILDDGSSLEVIAIVYALADLAMFGFMAVACIFAGACRPRPLLLLAASAAVTGFAGGAVAVALDSGWSQAPPLVGVAMVAGAVVLAAAAAFDDGRRYTLEEPAWALIAVPLAAALAAVLILIVMDHHSAPTYLADAVMALVVARLAVTLIDNRRAQEQRRRKDEERHAREEAERANRAKTEFLSRMSHEVRTPLNSILGFAQLLVDDVQAAERASVERILRGGNHLQRLLDDILDLSAIESGETAMSLEPTEVGHAIDESVALLEPLARASGTEVVRRTADDAAEAVLADPQRLKQVLLNLISNAIKYGGRDSKVVVSVEREGERAVVNVIDTGPGIADEHMASLFTPFERGSARGSNIEGSGLGLALTKNLVEAMGGAIDVDTGPAGSTFAVRLPVAEAEPAAAAPTERGDVGGSANGARTVVYIEDNQPNIALVERLLARRPEFDLLTATTGRAGLSLVDTVRPDVVLLDLDLPDIDGEEVLAHLRTHEATAGIPVIVVSADATAWRQERLARAGASAYVVKPIQLASFMGTLDDVLRRWPARWT